MKTPEELGHIRMMSGKHGNQNPDIQQEEVNQSVQEIALQVLDWVQYPDCAPAVGRFLPVFFKSLEESHSASAVHTSREGVLPLWVYPVKQTLERNQELMEVFEIHILPGLLRLGPADVEAFLTILPFESIQRGDIRSSNISDIHLCLLVAQIAEDSSLRNYFGQGQSTRLDPEILGISLLEHSSSSVRVSALSLLVSSSVSARPFCRRILRHLRQCLPNFHVEANAKPRNEFIALMKKLCMRLRSATMSLSRRVQNSDTLTEKQRSITTPSVAEFDGEGPLNSRNVVEQALKETLPILEDHLAFRGWYMMFLLQELRPTASYQSHITALKILNFVMDQPVDLRNTPSKIRTDNFGTLYEDVPRSLFLRPLTELLLDPFDDVRQSANTVFDQHFLTNSAPQRGTSRRGVHDQAHSVDLEAENQAHELDNERHNRRVNHSIFVDLNKAEKKTGDTGRADHADGFGRLNSLLFTTSGAVAKPASWHESRYLIVERVISTLEKEVAIAKDDLLFAVSSRPLHGHLIALR